MSGDPIPYGVELVAPVDLRAPRVALVAQLAATIYAGDNSHDVFESVNLAQQILAEAERAERAEP